MRCVAVAVAIEASIKTIPLDYKQLVQHWIMMRHKNRGMRLCLCLRLSLVFFPLLCPRHFFPSEKYLVTVIVISVCASNCIIVSNGAVESPECFAAADALKSENHNSYSPDHSLFRQSHPKKFAQFARQNVWRHICYYVRWIFFSSLLLLVALLLLLLLVLFLSIIGIKYTAP